MNLQKWLAAAALLAALGFVYPIRAQDEQEADDPTRGVARVSVIQGEVNVRRGDSGEVVAASVNAPLMAEDHLQTAAGSLAEVQFDSGNMVRLAPDTDLGFADVRYRRYQIQVATGTVMYRVLRDASADAEIDTPSISVRPLGIGEYRVTVNEDGTTEVTVRSGNAEIFSPAGSQRLAAGTTMLVRGSQSDPEFQEVAAIGRDQFDDWNHTRDSQLLRSRSYQYVASDVYGAEDLDDHGTWVPSEYGTVWQPRVAAGWAPYRAGRWVWEDYYGWTWVSYDPWGWAPYHYGRWFYNGGAGWCWWPGPVGHRHFWRPALVAFFGFGGGGFNVGFSFGNVGWVPLAPFEPWHPWYGRGYYGRGWGGYDRRTVIVNNTNIYNVYRNSRINNGITYTATNQFGRGRGLFNSGSGAQIRQAALVRGGLPIAPTRASLALSNRPAIVNTRVASVQNRQFYAHRLPANRERVPFATQQEHMAQFQQRTLGMRPADLGTARYQTVQGGYAQQRGFGSNVGSVSNAPGVFRGNSANSGTGGWRRMGDQNARTAPQGTGSYPQQNGSFRSYPQSATRPQASSPARASQPMAAENGGSQRFGQARMGNNGSGSFGSSVMPRSSQTPAYGDNDTNGWHRFGATPQVAPRQEGGTNYNRPQGPQPGSYSRPNYSYRSQSPQSEPLRFTQPMVRERPSYGGSRSYGYGGAQQSAPRYSAPASRSYGGNPGGQSYGGGNRGGGGAVRGGGAGGGSRGGGGGGHAGGGGHHR
jgi:hypothetical protein